MNAMELFIDKDRLRPVWRFLLSVVLLYAAVLVAVEVVGAAFAMTKAHPSLWVAAFWQTVAGLAAIIAASKVMTAVFERRPLRSIGLAFHSRWWRELGRGVVVGAAMLFLAIVPEWGCGFAHFSFTPHPMLRAGTFLLVMFALAAASEEILFRGYPFQRLVECITAAGAIAVTSAFFGFAHFANPHRTWVSTLNTALVGIPFCIAYLRTRALWMPIGIHLIWNFLLGFLLGLPVSGITITGSVLTARVRGPVWLTGGPYGPEGGLLAMGAILAATAYLLLSKSIYISEEMRTLTDSAAPLLSDRPITIFPASPEKEANADSNG
jgi:membrane protease YdiL (CAAX protease family)